MADDKARFREGVNSGQSANPLDVLRKIASGFVSAGGSDPKKAPQVAPQAAPDTCPHCGQAIPEASPEPQKTIGQRIGYPE
jgi:hypothetical protein